MLKINSTKREIVCWLIGNLLLKAIADGKLYIVKTPSGAEIRKVEDQQPVLFTKKHSAEDLEAAITNPSLGWRYCEAHPQNEDGTYNTTVKLCALVAPNEGFKLLSGPGPLEV